MVELGAPIFVRQAETESPEGREGVRSLMRDMEARLVPLTNWIPVSEDDFGKKGWRGVGETRAAVEEWYQVRAIESRANWSNWDPKEGSLFFFLKSGEMPTPSGGKLSRTVIFQSFCF